MDEPKELGLKVGTKSEVMWTQVVEDTERQIEQAKKSLTFLEAVLEMAIIKQEEEAEKKKLNIPAEIG